MNSVVIGIIVNEDDYILIGKPSQDKQYSASGILYIFPGGAVEAGETNEEALVREVYEETGLLVTDVSYIGERDHPVTGKRLYYYFCKKTGGILLPEEKEFEELLWVDKSELKKYIPEMFEKVSEFIRVHDTK